ncbi:MAG: CAP domain-containing protein [Candidatus Dormibacteria bacterium]
MNQRLHPALALERGAGPRAPRPGTDAEERFSAIADSGAAVRRTGLHDESSTSHRRRSATLIAVAGVSLAGLASVASARSATPAHAMATADSQLFALTNQDRTSNGVPALAWYSTLGTIGENGSYGGCGFNVQGRAQDMINRNYFAHPILGCGQYVWSMMSAYGVPFRSAGENIGWNTYADQAASVNAVNSAFMNSPEHRANILNASFDHMGVGSANSGGGAWTGGGGAYTDVSMYAEEFAQLGGTVAPATTAIPVAAPAPASAHQTHRRHRWTRHTWRHRHYRHVRRYHR